jgi:polar amino acid transport system substrate-binding protein
MRTRAVAMAIVAALAAAACGSSGGTTASPGGSTQANPCAKSNLQLVTSGQLTIGTDNPAFDPYFQGPTGHEWTGQFNHDPYNDQGFEDATAYAVAQQLGFTKDQVKWVAVPFNNSYKPGPKNFDFYLAQVSYSPQRAQGADLSDSYYDVQQAVVALQGTPIASATSVADLKSYTFGTQIGTTSYDLIQNVVQPSQSTQVYDTLNAALQALKNGQIDGLVTDFPTAYYMANIQLDNGTVVGILPNANSASPEHFSMVLQKGSSLTPCVNAALSALHADGTLAQIQDRWLNQAAHAPALQ